MAKIGVFDSGLGGLTVLRAIRKKLPCYDFIYLGDTARAPYGSRSKKEVYEFTKEAVGYLFSRDCELVILACNTASSDALRRIQQEYLPKKYPQKRVLGVVIPTCEEAVDEGHKHVAVMATESTVLSGSYVREIKKLDNEAKIVQLACPEIVPAIEQGLHDGDLIKEIVSKYLASLNKNPEAIILGCTHYEIIKSKISEVAPKTKIISQSDLVAEKLFDYLERHPEIEGKLSRNGLLKIFVTGKVRRFQKLSEIILGHSIRAKKVYIN